MSREAKTLLRVLSVEGIELDPRAVSLLDESPLLQRSLVEAFGVGGIDAVVQRTSAWLQFA